MEVDFVFPDYRFPDPNNLLKALIDAFEGIIFENDKWCLPTVNARIEKGVKRTTVRFYFNE